MLQILEAREKEREKAANHLNVRSLEGNEEKRKFLKRRLLSQCERVAVKTRKLRKYYL